MTRNEPLTWVGVAGFEPAASSSRTTAGSQVGGGKSPLTSGFMLQGVSARLGAIPPLDASVTHGRGPAAPISHARNKQATSPL